jgi:cytochrome c biogenesis protein CcmG/thiol:disulfide interchange protein DsbE
MTSTPNSTRGLWRYLLPVAVLLGLVVFFYLSLGRDMQTLPSPLIGKPAPQFELPSLEDPAQLISNRELAGRMYLLNVWGSWCVGCRQEHDTLVEIARRGDIPILGLNWKDEREAAQHWLRSLGDPYIASAFDDEGRVAIDWGVYGAPETFLVDAAGQIIHKQIGPLDLQIWERDFAPRIRSGRSAGGAANP